MCCKCNFRCKFNKCARLKYGRACGEACKCKDPEHVFIPYGVGCAELFEHLFEEEHPEHYLSACLTTHAKRLEEGDPEEVVETLRVELMEVRRGNYDAAPAADVFSEGYDEEMTAWGATWKAKTTGDEAERKKLVRELMRLGVGETREGRMRGRFWYSFCSWGLGGGYEGVALSYLQGVQ